MIANLLPDTIAPLSAALLVFASFFTSLLTASFGIGGGLMLLSIMTYVVPISALIPVHGAVQFGSNSGRAILQRHSIAWPELAAFLAGGVIGALAGARLVVDLPSALLQGGLGLFVLAITWIRPPKMARMGLGLVALTGAITTFLAMFFGATGPLNAAAFEKSFPDRRQMVATLAALMATQHVLKIVAFATAGFAFSEWLPLILAMMVTGFAGTRVGLVILGRIEEKTFRFGLKLVLTVIALDLIRRGWMAN